MITFRKLIGNINVTKELSQQSSLEQWFEHVLDMPIEELTVEDLCRAIRQGLCIDQLMPRVLEVLADDPLAGEYYDGELIAALSTIKEKNLKGQRNNFIKIQRYINQLAPSDISVDLRRNILKINKILA